PSLDRTLVTARRNKSGIPPRPKVTGLPGGTSGAREEITFALRTEPWPRIGPCPCVSVTGRLPIPPTVASDQEDQAASTSGNNKRFSDLTDRPLPQSHHM